MDSRKKHLVRKCAALGCPVTSETHPHMRLFNFPRQYDGKLIRYNKWVQFSNNPSLINGRLRSASLCSGHFKNRHFKSSKRDTLHHNAIPTIRNHELKIRKSYNKPFPISKKTDCKPTSQTSKSMSKPINFDTITSRLIFNNNITGIFKKTNANSLIIESSQNIERGHSSREEASTTLTVATLSKLFGKPPDIASNVPFDKWITFAKSQNIICDQVEYALCTAKRLTDFMRSKSPIDNNEPFYGFEDDEESDFVLMDWTDEETLAAISFELNQIDTEISKLNKRKSELIERREQLTDKASLEKSKILADKDWDRTDFPWYDKLMSVLNNVFKIKGLRSYQLPTMNATLSGHHVILIMPTGGGKSLCYQLPALVDKGITLVISPLVALMEDQVMALRNLNVDVGMFHADCDKAEANRLMQAMTDKNSQLKLIYLTPEKLAKSKRFMSKLQKCYEMGRLSRIAIDEVHCCSQWGHDFRPDYKFLGVLNSMFSEVPILGLTATATTKVTVDVQKMLDIQGCLTFKASFNRPNLYYEVRPKPSSLKDCVDELEDLMKHRFANKSGIIYTTTIKDCADLRNELRQRGLKVSGYHANLDPNQRSSVHRKWITGEYQAVVATIAFGLGIDKPDVRFVIHHALSKSMENFYQESGRAGRDGNPADCILFYRLGDIFKLSPMVFSQQTGLKCLYGIVEYCLDVHRCRRLMIASHFDESWESTDCKSMCDHCRNPRQPKEVDITKHCQSLYKLIANGAKCDTKLTAQKLLEAWYGKGPAQLRSSDVSAPSFARDTGEAIIAYLIIKDYLKEDFHFTPYSTISYLRRGNMAATLNDPKHQIAMTVRGKAMSLDNTNETSDGRSKSLTKVKTVSKKNLFGKLNTSESVSEVVVIKSNVKRQRSENSSPQVSKRKVILIESDSE